MPSGLLQSNQCHCVHTLPSYSDPQPSGSVLPVASAVPSPCSIGTYNVVTGATDISFCQLYTADSYCASAGLSAVTGSCIAGNYCPSGQSVATPANFLCPVGLPDWLRCGIQVRLGLLPPTAHMPCPAGFICNNDGRSIELDATQYPCAPGYYCPVSTSYAHRFRPIVTYSNTTQLRNSTQCLSCQACQYCGAAGQTAPTASCAAGYYCVQNAQSARAIAWYRCQCLPDRVVLHQRNVLTCACPVGSYGNRTGLRDASEFISCPPGLYCGSAGLSTPSGSCQSSYYCNGSATDPTGQGQGGLCPAGSYCPTGTGVPLPCPVGSFSNATGINASTNCLACSPGSYCNSLGLTAPAGLCAAGYYCVARSGTP